MKADQRKQQILEAALTAFAEHGYERTSIAIICQKAGIARPTLYQYFKDKRSLFRELLEGYLLTLHSGIHSRQREKDGHRELSPKERNRSIHRELLEEMTEHRDFLTIFFKEAKAKNAETEDIVTGIMNALMRELMKEMGDYPNYASLSREDMEFTVLYMLGGMMQVTEWYLFSGKQSLTAGELADKITDIEARIKGI